MTAADALAHYERTMSPGLRKMVDELMSLPAPARERFIATMVLGLSVKMRHRDEMEREVMQALDTAFAEPEGHG